MKSIITILLTIWMLYGVARVTLSDDIHFGVDNAVKSVTLADIVADSIALTSDSDDDVKMKKNMIRHKLGAVADKSLYKEILENKSISDLSIKLEKVFNSDDSGSKYYISENFKVANTSYFVKFNYLARVNSFILVRTPMLINISILSDNRLLSRFSPRSTEGSVLLEAILERKNLQNVLKNYTSLTK